MCDRSTFVVSLWDSLRRGWEPPPKCRHALLPHQTVAPPLRGAQGRGGYSAPRIAGASWGIPALWSLPLTFLFYAWGTVPQARMSHMRCDCAALSCGLVLTRCGLVLTRCGVPVWRCGVPGGRCGVPVWRCGVHGWRCGFVALFLRFPAGPGRYLSSRVEVPIVMGRGTSARRRRYLCSAQASS